MVLRPRFENHYSEWDFPCSSDGRASAYNAGDLGSIPGSGSTLVWKIPWMEEPGRLQFMGSQRVGHNWATSLSAFFIVQFSHPYMTTGKTFGGGFGLIQQVIAMWETWVRSLGWRRKWQPTPVLLPGKSHGHRSLVGYSSWGHKESDMTKRPHFLSFYQVIWTRCLVGI